MCSVAVRPLQAKRVLGHPAPLQLKLPGDRSTVRSCDVQSVACSSVPSVSLP